MSNVCTFVIFFILVEAHCKKNHLADMHNCNESNHTVLLSKILPYGWHILPVFYFIKF